MSPAQYNSCMLSKPTVIVHCANELRVLINDIIAKEGPACSLNHIDVSNVTQMIRLFHDSPFNGTISDWDVSNVTDFWGMFLGSPFTGDISNWNTESAIEMGSMFQSSWFSGEVSRWNTSNVQSMGQLFHGNTNFQGDVSNWDVSNVLRFDHMFYENNWRGDLSKWSPHTKATFHSIVEFKYMPHLAAPSFFHWEMVLHQYQNAPDQVLSPSWRKHFDNVRSLINPIARGLGLSRHETAVLYQKSWLQKKCHEKTLLLPALDDSY